MLFFSSYTDLTKPSTEGGGFIDLYGTDLGPSAIDAQAVVSIDGQPCKETLWLGKLADVLQPPNAASPWFVLRCIFPGGSGTNNSVVVSVGGQQVTVASLKVTYELPTITEIIPRVIPTGETTRMTVTGENFGSNQNVISLSVGDLTCTGVRMEIPNTEFTCDLPEYDYDHLLSAVVSVSEQSSGPFIVGFEFVPVSQSMKIVVNGIASVCLLIGFAFLMALIYRRHHRSIKAGSALFSILTVVGGMVSLIGVYFLGNEHHPDCFTAFWFIFTGFSIMFASLLLKNFRILKLFRNQTLRPTMLSDTTLLMYVVGFVVFDIATLVPYMYLSTCGRPDGVGGLVIAVLIFSEKLAMMAFGVLLAFQSRVIHIKEFNERIQLGYAIYNIAFVVLIVMPIMFLMEGNNESVYLLQSCVVMFLSISTISIMLLPKFYVLYLETNGIADNDDGQAAMTTLETQRTFRTSTRNLTRTGTGLTRQTTVTVNQSDSPNINAFSGSLGRSSGSLQRENSGSPLRGRSLSPSSSVSNFPSSFNIGTPAMSARLSSDESEASFRPANASIGEESHEHADSI
jgi:7 transmembrane sweet-taste receptor of 3 GCPR/IPT/TIG domain